MSVSVSLTVERRPVVGQFGKGTPGSVALNFAPSNGINCDPDCDAWNVCYAVPVEKMKKHSLGVTLQRHAETDPDALINGWLVELIKRHASAPIPWIRISAFGSVPSRPDKKTRYALVRLLTWSRSQGIPVHFPVETARKARRYRAIVGDLAVVRVSTGTNRRRRGATSNHLSCIVGARGQSLRDRMAESIATAREIQRVSGRKARVCPAIMDTFTRKLQRGRPASPKAKCGACTLCADDDVYAIIYPLH